MSDNFVTPEVVESGAVGPVSDQTSQTGQTGPPDENGYICDEPGCDRVFPTLQGVTMHKIRSHGKGWSTTSNLQKSPNWTPGIPERTVCTLCGRSITQARLNSHLRRVHNATAPKKKTTHGYECEICGNIMSSRDSLRGHMYRAHNSERERLDRLPNLPVSTTRMPAVPSQISDEGWQERAAAVNRASAELTRLTAERADYKLNLSEFTVDDDVVILRSSDGSMWMLRRIG